MAQNEQERACPAAAEAVANQAKDDEKRPCFDEKNPWAAAAHGFSSSNRSRFSADGECYDENLDWFVATSGFSRRGVSESGRDIRRADENRDQNDENWRCFDEN
jgi:hypothetical protein